MRPEDDPPWDADELRAIWEEHRPTTFARVAALERAVALLAEGRLGDGDARSARREAHSLSGAVSFFGYDEASRIAAELETIFSDATGADPDRLHDMVVKLRSELERLPYTS